MTLGAENCGGTGLDSWSKPVRLIPGCDHPAGIWDVSYAVAGRQVVFTSTVGGEEPVDYLWSFGDGQVSAAEDPVHLYREYGRYTPTLTVSNCGGLAWDAWQEALEIRPTPCVLLVDDDQEDPDVRAFYASTLETLGLAYEVWDVAGRGSPASADLRGHAMVLWFTGLPWNRTFGPADEAVVADYLDLGGRFFLSSEDYLYDRGLTSFGQYDLGISSYTDDVKAEDPVGRGGDPIGDGLGPYDLTPPAGWHGTTLWTDAVTGTQGSPFLWQGGRQANSTAYDGGDFRTVFFGWPLEGLADVQDRAAVLARVVNWFGGCGLRPAMRVRPAGLEATLEIGGRLTQTLELSNAGTELLTFTLGELDPGRPAGGDLPWLSEAPVSGTVAPGERRPVRVTYDAAGLPPGLYPGLLEVKSSDAVSPSVSVPATLTVLPPCQPIYRIYLPLVAREPHS